jgi:hypothetical protein
LHGNGLYARHGANEPRIFLASSVFCASPRRDEPSLIATNCLQPAAIMRAPRTHGIFDRQRLGYHLILAPPTPPPSMRESIIHAGQFDPFNRLFERQA